MKKVLLTLSLLVSAISAWSQICYRIEGNRLSSPSYLFGTHHLAPLSVFDSNLGAKQAFAEAKIVVGETDMSLLSDMGTALKMQQLMVAPADSTISKLMPAEKLPVYREEFAKLVPGASLDMFEGFKPFVAVNVATLSVVSQNFDGFNPEEQLDTWFQAQGKIEGKELVTFETPIEQAEMLYSVMPIRIQINALCKLLDEPETIVAESRNLNEAYLQQDLEKLLEISQDEEDPESAAFNDLILLNRNKVWLEKLPAIMEKASAFVAVGALHLPGPDGLVEGLKKMGYAITPVK